MFRHTAYPGVKPPSVPSLSSASATKYLPPPICAFVRRFGTWAPTQNVGALSLRVSTQAIMDVVVLFPCVPATAMLYRCVINALSNRPRRTVATPSSTVARSSSFSPLTADV